MPNTNFEHIRPSVTAMNNINIQTLKNYPNRQSPIGNNLSPEELKKRFDAQSEYLGVKLSALVDTLQSNDISTRLLTDFEKNGTLQTLKEKLQELTATFNNYKTSAELAATEGGTVGASLIGARKRISEHSVSYAPLQTLLDEIYTLISNLETKVGSDSVASVATDISKAILALKELIDNVYTKSQTYTKTEINTQQTAQDNRLTSLETKQGSDNIADIAPDISKAILSLNEDIDSLQLGVVPRVIRGIIEADTSYGALTAELRALLNAKVTEVTGRETPNNTDAVQVFDIGEPDKNIMYTYYYWDSNVNEDVPSELNGWYLAYSALSQMINNEECYTLNFSTSAWSLGQDGYYYIEKTAQDHEMGSDNTIDIKLLQLIDGNYEEVRQFYVSSSGTVTLFTDEVFSGTLMVRTGKAFRVPTLVVNQSQIDGLEEDLTALENNKADKVAIAKQLATKKTNYLAIKLKAETYLNERFEAKTWTGLTSFGGYYIWTDGTNIYYSRGPAQFVLDVATSTVSTKTWTGLTNFDGSRIWTDGTNIYYSDNANQYVLDVATSTWSPKTWTGLTSFHGIDIWTDGINIYYSFGTSQYVLDVATSTWSIKTWTGLTDFYGDRIWTDGTNIYYSSDANQYVLDVATSTWSVKTWTGLTSFYGSRIWTDGTNIYYSNDSTQRVLDVATSTWSVKTWTGLTSFSGWNIWTDGTNIYYSELTDHYKIIPKKRLR